MYKNLVFKKILIGMAMIFISAGLLFLLSLLSINENNEIFVVMLFGGLYVFVWYYAFFIYFLDIKIKSISKDITPSSAEEIKNKIRSYFSEACQNDEPIFQLEEIQDGLQISWNRRINFKQILNYGSQEVNYKTSFFFDDHKKTCNIHSQIIHISKSAGIAGLSYSIDFKGGVIYETGVDYRPSFEVKDGNIHIDIKKLSYDNASMIDPVIEICKKHGWASSFLMFKHKIARMLYVFSGLILLLISISMFLFGTIGIIAGS